MELCGGTEPGRNVSAQSISSIVQTLTNSSLQRHHHRPAARPQPRHHNLVNSIQMSPVQINTTEVATDTVQYVATDSAGLTATSTRTVLIEPAASSDAAATETEATSTAQ